MTNWKPDICIYHGDCLDGFGAAWAIWKRWRDCDFRPGYYGKGLPLNPYEVAGKNILFVDFSAPWTMLAAISSEAASVVVLDHHKTAKADLEAYCCAGEIAHFEAQLAARREDGRLPIIAYFDESRSGATMAYDLARGTQSLPDLLLYIQDRDLWNFERGDTTRQIAAALQSYPMDFATWDAFHLPSLIVEGAALLRSHRANVEKILEFSHTAFIGEFLVPVANAPYQFASDVGNELLKLHPEAPFAASFFTPKPHTLQWSLRSEDSRIDVSIVAKARGGGGHRNAAGFVERT